jgi:hypothetical protein
MSFIKRFIVALGAGLIFFALSVVIIVVFGYVLAKIDGFKYIFIGALTQGIRSGLSLGVVVAILMFIGGSQSRVPRWAEKEKGAKGNKRA